jgi:hypothetical protein
MSQCSTSNQLRILILFLQVTVGWAHWGCRRAFHEYLDCLLNVFLLFPECLEESNIRGEGSSKAVGMDDSYVVCHRNESQNDTERKT